MELGDEDVSARVLLRQLLHAESPRRPVTRSIIQSLEQNSRTRQSTQLHRNAAGLQSPHMALRQKLKDRLHESASRSPVQGKRRLSTRVSKDRPLTPASGLPLDDEDVTARGLLRGILQTEPEMSLIVPVQSAKEDAEPGSAESTMYSSQPSVEMTDLELPDLTIASATTAVRGISRKRPQKNIDLSMFVKKLNEGGDQMDEQQPETSNLSTLSPQSVSLSLNTPYVDPHTEKRGLRRTVKRRVIDVENFEEGVQKHLVRKMNTDMEQRQRQAHRMSETGPLEKFSLGFTDLTTVDTTDIIMSSTALSSLPVSQSPEAKISVAEGDTMTGMQSQRNEAEEVQKQAEDQQSYMGRSGDEGEENMEVEFLLDEEKLKDNMSEQHRNNTVEEQEVVLLGKQHILPLCVKEVVIESEQEEEEPAEELQMQEGEGSGNELQLEEKGGKSQKVFTLEAGKDKMVSEPLPQTLQTGSEELTSTVQHTTQQTFSHSEGSAMLPRVMERGQDYRNQSSALQDMAIEAGVSPTWADPDKDKRSSEEETSGIWHAESEAGVKNQEVERSSLVSSPHMLSTSSLGPRDPPSRRSWKTVESMGTNETKEVEIPVNISREIFTGDFQNKYNLSPSQELEPLEHDMSSVLAPTQGVRDLGATEASQGEESMRESDQDDGFLSEECSMKTPAFVRQKRNVQTPEPQTTPNFLKMKSKKQFPKVVAATKPKPQLKRQGPATKKNPGLPKSYVMSTFKHFAKTKVSPDVYPVLKEIMDKYFDRLADDLEAYAAHAKRTTIQVEDVELLLRRQGFVTDSMPVSVLIERYLPLEYRKLLIPVATSGNNVVPKQRR